MNEKLKSIRDALHARADLNGDGTLNKKDVELVLSRITVQTQKAPLGTLLYVAAAAFVLGAIFCKLFL